MGKNAVHPRAEHPLENLAEAVECTFPSHHRTFLTALMLESSLQQCGDFVRGLVLDVGCGRRPYEKTFFKNAKRYIGSDYLSDRSRPDVIASALELPFVERAFDTVVSTEVLEHVPKPLDALNEMRRVLKPGGYLILTTPMYWPRHEAPYDYFRYPYDGLLHLVKESQMEVARLFNRGRSYAFVGQVIQHVQPFNFRPLTWIINQFFLWCERHLDHDAVTLGWTLVARKPLEESAPAKSPTGV